MLVRHSTHTLHLNSYPVLRQTHTLFCHTHAHGPTGTNMQPDFHTLSSLCSATTTFPWHITVLWESYLRYFVCSVNFDKSFFSQWKNHFALSFITRCKKTKTNRHDSWLKVKQDVALMCQRNWMKPQFCPFYERVWRLLWSFLSVKWFQTTKHSV